MDFMRSVMGELKKGGPLEPGDKQAFVLDDAVVVVELDEARELKIQVCLEPARIEGVRTGYLDDES